MKLKQREFCHNCRKHVDFEFEDVVGWQIIYCPVCGHEHYRELDETTLTQVRINMKVPTGVDRIVMCKTPKLYDMTVGEDVGYMDEMVKYKEMKIIAKFIKRVILDKEKPEKVKKDVIEFRRNFQKVKYTFKL